MAASRLNASLDRPSTTLINVTKALMLAGERAMPRSTARSAWDLSRAVRAALEANEGTLAQALLAEIPTLLDGESSTYAETVLRRVKALNDSISFDLRRS